MQIKRKKKYSGTEIPISDLFLHLKKDSNHVNFSTLKML